MESCLLVCRMEKPEERKGKIIFIDAKDELRIERTNAWLEPKHIQKISDAYLGFNDIEGFSKVVTNLEVLGNNGNLSLQLHVKQNLKNTEHDIVDLINIIDEGQKLINESFAQLLIQLRKNGIFP